MFGASHGFQAFFVIIPVSGARQSCMPEAFTIFVTQKKPGCQRASLAIFDLLTVWIAEPTRL